MAARHDFHRFRPILGLGQIAELAWDSGRKNFSIRAQW
jgi:hypothetical protein